MLRLAHRLAVLLPLVIAFAVNFGVAPLLFSQVLYGHLFYTSSILMASFWLAVIPILILAYYGAYLYDFRFQQLAGARSLAGPGRPAMLLVIGYFFVNNMLLMILPERFAEYFEQHGRYDAGRVLIPSLLPRYLHMMTGALAIGGLFVALVGRFQADRDPELAAQARDVGLQTFFWGTARQCAERFLVSAGPAAGDHADLHGRNLPATICFAAGSDADGRHVDHGLEEKILADLLAWRWPWSS